jgi:hypothetical protein
MIIYLREVYDQILSQSTPTKVFERKIYQRQPIVNISNHLEDKNKIKGGTFTLRFKSTIF